MNNPNLNPDVLAYLEEERRFNETRGGSRIRRVKIEKPGQAWLVRFLPVALGQSGLFYVRDGKHWVHKTPITCPRSLSTDFGGDPQAFCPVCDLAETLNAEDHEEVSKFGYRLRANVTYITYCVVFEIDLGRGDNQVMSQNEILRPWEFVHYQGSFDELTNYFKRGKTAQRPWSVLDLKKGNDFWATKVKGKGIRLERNDPGPILTLDANFDKYVGQIMAAIHEPKLSVPTEKQLETFARKAEAAAYGEDEPEERPRHGRDRDEEEDASDEEEEGYRHHRGRSRGAPVRRGAAPEAVDEPEPESASEEAAAEPQADEDQPKDAAQKGQENGEVDVVNEQAEAAAAEKEDHVPGAEVPARQTARPVPTKTAPPARQAMQARTAAPAARPAATNAARPAAGTQPPPPAAGRAAAPAAAAAGARRPASAAQPLRRVNQAPAQETVNEEEDPGVAEEAQDQAGATEPLPEDAQETPPPQRPAGNTKLRAHLAQRIQSANSPR